ncbi:hypothetical protein [Methylocapsa sp. S129]|uniref:hypothetical protein n=1 Tax=Methylocapsa sp. S129 TaxID=1641869 RepID=UPI00131CAA74|nr:hypothetical protein [Methylocapsa sp. S129]
MRRGYQLADDDDPYGPGTDLVLSLFAMAILIVGLVGTGDAIQSGSDAGRIGQAPTNTNIPDRDLLAANQRNQELLSRITALQNEVRDLGRRGPPPPNLSPQNPTADNVLTQDPAQKAYEEFLNCTAGQSGCPAKACAQTYLTSFPSGQHAVEVNKDEEGAEKVCQVENLAKTAAEDFSSFQGCMAQLSVCDQHLCVERFQARLAIEPYVSMLRKLGADAAKTCETSRQDALFASFQQCIQSSAPCDRAACEEKLNGALMGPRAVEITRTLDDAKAICEVQKRPSPQFAARELLNEFYRTLGEKGQGPDKSFAELYAPKVAFYGQPITREAAVAAKNETFKKLSGAAVTVRQDSVEINCDPDGATCNVTGWADGEFTNLNGSTQNTSFQFRFVFSNVLTNPQVTSEAVTNLTKK